MNSVKNKKFLELLMIFSLLFVAFLLAGCDLFSTPTDEGKKSKTEITENMIWVRGTYQYTGSEIIPDDENIVIKVDGTTVENKYFTFTYENNINAGDAVLVVTCNKDNPYLYGSVRKTFDINAIDVILTNPSELNNSYNSQNTRRLLIDCDVTINEN